jgi:lipid-binding SYLF domain-containing protein
MRAEILTYSRARGAFAGISLKGAVLRPDKDANKSLYSRDIDVRELVEKGVDIPEPAQKFVQAVSQAAR